MPQAGNREAESSLRATQSLVSHMSFCWRHPSVTAIEVGWRWLFGAPFLLLLQAQSHQVLLRIPPNSVGFNHLDFQNPWVSTAILADAAGLYEPAVADVLRWLAPLAVVVWAVVSGVGRTFVLSRMERFAPDRSESSKHFMAKIPGVILLQGVWLIALLACFYGWFQGVAWASRTHLNSATEPDLIGYLIWLIFLSLTIYTIWALVSWTLSIAPILYLNEGGSIGAVLVRGFRLGRTVSSKLLEINLVMAIVKIALIVLAMVFSAAPLPFSDLFGPGGLNNLYIGIGLAYLLANDYFHAVRLKSFVEFWRRYRGDGMGRKI